MSLFSERQNQSALNFDFQYCTNHLTELPSCDFCYKACPNGAINYENKKLSINLDLCNDCGICMQACPMNVFHFEEKCNYFENHTIMLTCDKHTFKKQGAYACLYNLNFFDLLMWLINGQTLYLIYNETTCMTCNQFNKDYFLERLAHYQIIFPDFAPKINFISKEAFADLKLKKETKPSQNRRSLLKKSLSTSLKMTMAHIGEQAKIASLTETIDKEKSKSPKIWQCLDALKAQYPINPKAKLPLLTLMASNCDFCEKCVRNCPQNALSIFEGETTHLLFEPKKCTNCNQCLLSCPKKALSYGSELSSTLLEKEVIYSLYKLPRL